MIAYVGCRTTKERNARGKGISVYEIKDGEWTLKQCIYNEQNPSFQCFDNNKEYLYTVHGDSTKASAYKILSDGCLEFLNTIEFPGRNPVDITTDAQNAYVIIATLQGGTYYAVKRNEDGSLGEISATYTFEGKEQGKVSTIHQCLWDINKRYLIGCAQGRGNGYGQLRVLKYNAEDIQFSEADRFMARKWDEPRHAAMHPNNRWLYMIEELANKIIYFDFDEENGRIKPLQELSTLPEYETRQSEAGEIMIAPGGEYLLVSNRSTDIMTVFHIDRKTGYLRATDYASCMGKTPRFFCFGPNGKCYVANEDSDSIVEFDFDCSIGKLIPTGIKIETGSPVCLSFA